MSGTGLPKGNKLQVMEVLSLVLEPNQSKWTFPLYEARRKYTTTVHYLFHSGAEVRIEFDLEDGVDPVFSERPAQHDDLGPGNISQPGSRRHV